MWHPKVSYGTGPTVFTFSQPITAPSWPSVGIGGADETASGLGFALELRRDYLAKATLRFFESELADVEAWIHWAQRNRHLTFEFWFDKDDAATQRSVYLKEPDLEKGFDPERQSFAPLFMLPVTLKRASNEPFGLNWSSWSGL